MVMSGMRRCMLCAPTMSVLHRKQQHHLRFSFSIMVKKKKDDDSVSGKYKSKGEILLQHHRYQQPSSPSCSPSPSPLLVCGQKLYLAPCAADVDTLLHPLELSKYHQALKAELDWKVAQTRDRVSDGHLLKFAAGRIALHEALRSNAFNCSSSNSSNYSDAGTEGARVVHTETFDITVIKNHTNGSLLLPTHILGSISHKGNWAVATTAIDDAATVASAAPLSSPSSPSSLLGLGIDLEYGLSPPSYPSCPPPPGAPTSTTSTTSTLSLAYASHKVIMNRVLTDGEKEAVRSISLVTERHRYARLCFSFKEAVYKAIFHLVGERYVGFKEVQVTIPSLLSLSLSLGERERNSDVPPVDKNQNTSKSITLSNRTAEIEFNLRTGEVFECEAEWIDITDNIAKTITSNTSTSSSSNSCSATSIACDQCEEQHQLEQPEMVVTCVRVKRKLSSS